MLLEPIPNTDKSKLWKMVNELDKVVNKNNKHASFFKICNHVHTPASHDYFFYVKNNKKTLKEITFCELLNIAIKENLLLKNNYDESAFNHGFSSPKEELAFLIFVNRIIKEKIKAIIITDHNTIKGYSKTQQAVKVLKEQLNRRVKCALLSGIEISCADRNHIVGIFDFNKHSDKIKKWIKNNIMSEVDGTYLTSIDVLTFINSIDGVGYIAHANSNQLINEGKHFSGAYKKKLFNLSSMNIIGVKKLEHIKPVRTHIKPFLNKNKILFPILDEDSHCIEDLGTNFFWIKGEKVDFYSFKASIKDFNLHFLMQKNIPVSPRYYIKGLYVSGTGFLRSKINNAPYVLSFSDRMNSFIGGRGTGKSTTLDILSFILSQQIYDKKKLRFLMNNGSLMALVSYNNEDYYILFNNTNNKTNNENFISEYIKIGDKGNTNNKENRDLRKQCISNRIQVFQKKEEKLYPITNGKVKLLDKLFTRSFSINSLTEIIEKDGITDFVLGLLDKSYNINKHSIIAIENKFNSLEDIDHTIKLINDFVNKRRNKIEVFINKFNSKYPDRFKLEYKPKNINKIKIHWNQIFSIYSREQYKKYYRDFNITNINLISYLSDISEIYGTMNIIKLINTDNYVSIMKIANIMDYCSEKNIESVNRNLKELNQKQNFIKFIKKIKHDLNLNFYLIKKQIDSYLNNFDYFSLYFNTNHKATNRTIKDTFKNVLEISMGQKVVAMMGFILSFDGINKINNPLIIDQPEDNLDNQYIYNNLVQDLINAKGKRQVIIASHNSTVVVNSGTEKVIVMDSNGITGWIEQSGYLLNNKIISYIINILEGGSEAFRKKINIYGYRL